ncbi:jg2164, partial [Pararge aegeria aegeria]
MFAIRSLLRTNTQFAKNAVQQRNMSAFAVPARNKISKGHVLVECSRYNLERLDFMRRYNINRFDEGALTSLLSQPTTDGF